MKPEIIQLFNKDHIILSQLTDFVIGEYLLTPLIDVHGENTVPSRLQPWFVETETVGEDIILAPTKPQQNLTPTNQEILLKWVRGLEDEDSSIIMVSVFVPTYNKALIEDTGAVMSYISDYLQRIWEPALLDCVFHTSGDDSFSDYDPSFFEMARNHFKAFSCYKGWNEMIERIKNHPLSREDFFDPAYEGWNFLFDKEIK